MAGRMVTDSQVPQNMSVVVRQPAKTLVSLCWLEEAAAAGRHPDRRWPVS